MKTRSQDEIRELQVRLNEGGFAFREIGETLETDGVYGSKTDRVYRAYLDRDPAIPSVTPRAALPWWRKPSLIVVVSGIASGALGIFGFEVDSAQMAEIFNSFIGFAVLAVGLYQTLRGEPPVDSTLVSRLPGGRDLRSSGVRPRLPAKRRPDQPEPEPRKDDARGNFNPD